jgi:hypothetical protein
MILKAKPAGSLHTNLLELTKKTGGQSGPCLETPNDQQVTFKKGMN